MMPHVDTPWVGLAALVAMFVVPFLPGWLFEGPRTVKHYPRRQVCGDCGAPWADDHVCSADRAPVRHLLRRHLLRRQPLRRQPLRRQPLRRQPLRRQPLRRQPLRVQLRRVRTSTALVRRSPRHSETDNF
jgi:hypothetical protein